MGGSASSYERELKDLLEADPEAVERYERALPPADRAVLRTLTRSPYLVVRAAGSLGFDLVALQGELSFPVEVKASSFDTIRFSAASGRATEQLEAHRRAVDRVGLIVLYAYRRLGLRGGDRWRIYAAGTPSRANSRTVLLSRRLPHVSATASGNGILRWDDGMPLVRFLGLVQFLTAPPSEGPA